MEWVATRTIFDVCVCEKEFEAWERIHVMWWRKKAAEEQLSVTVEAISAAETFRRQHESGRHDRSKVWSEGERTYINELGCGDMNQYDGIETGDTQVIG